MSGGGEPAFGVAGGEQVGVEVDHNAADFGAGHGLGEIHAGLVVIRKFLWRLGLRGFCWNGLRGHGVTIAMFLGYISLSLALVHFRTKPLGRLDCRLLAGADIAKLRKPRRKLQFPLTVAADFVKIISRQNRSVGSSLPHGPATGLHQGFATRRLVHGQP
jgi:hypothetical protein